MTQFKEFNYVAYIKGEAVQYRCGEIPLEVHFFRTARLGLVNRVVSVTVIGTMKTHHDNGLFDPDKMNDYDLVMKPKKKTYYINVYKRPNGKLVTYNNSLQIKEPEVIIRDYQDEFIGTFPIEIEE